MGSRTTIRDVAERAGVSSATVSNVLNEKGKVSESTRKDVEAAIDALNYQRGTPAQNADPADAKTVGLVIKELHNPYFADVSVGAQQKANEEGYAFVLASSEGRRCAEVEAVEVLMEKDLEGVIINPLLDRDADLSHLFTLERRNIPFVLLEEVHGLKANLVDVDNVQAARDITSYLFGLGHERVIHFAGPEHSMHSAERVEGFRQAFFESGQVYTQNFVVRVGARRQHGYEAGMEYFGDRPPSERPTGVTCYNDLVAIGLLRALRELEIQVPEEVSVTGFDNTNPCKYAPVPLTSVGVPTVDMGRAAMEVLIRQIEGVQRSEPEIVTLEAEIVKRASTAPAKQTASA